MLTAFMMSCICN